MADYAITRWINRFPDFVPDGHELAVSMDGARAYIFDRAGNVVSTLRRDGENDETLRFRLRAGLLAVGVSEDG